MKTPLITICITVFLALNITYIAQAEKDQQKQQQDDTVRYNPYFISIGSSFNFIDGINSNNVYADLGLFKKGFLKKNDTITSRIGIDVGIINGRSVVTDSLLDLRRPADTTVVDRIITTETKNLNLFGTLTYNITKNDGILFWNILHAEVRQREFLIDIKETTSDSIVKDTRIKRSVSQGFFGTGLTIHFLDTSKRVEFKLKAVIGLNVNDRQFRDKRPFAYLIQFNLMEKNTGIKLGGEVRGVKGFSPEILIYLAKQFTLEKLIGIFKD